MQHFRYTCTFSSPALNDETRPEFQRVFDETLGRIIRDVNARPLHDGAGVEAPPSAWLQKTKRLATTFRGASDAALQECMTEFKAAFATAIHSTIEMKAVRIVVNSVPGESFPRSALPPRRGFGGADLFPGTN